MTTPTSTSVTAGSSWTLNEVTENAANPSLNASSRLCVPAPSNSLKEHCEPAANELLFLRQHDESSGAVASAFVEQLILLCNMSHPLLLGV